MSYASGLSDSDLDTAFAIGFDQHDQAVADFYAAEINAKLHSIAGSMQSVFGASGDKRFPKFAARTGLKKSLLPLPVLLIGGAVLFFWLRKK